jgi:hypothetical protein
MKMLIVPDCPLVLSAMSSVVSLRFVVPTSVMWVPRAQIATHLKDRIAPEWRLRH